MEMRAVGTGYILISSFNSLPEKRYKDSMLYARAFWVSKSIIAWDVDAGDGSCYLFSSKNATLSVANGEIHGYDIQIKLEECNEKLPEHVTEKFPHIRDFKHFQVPPALDVKTILKHQLAFAVLRSGGECTCITGLQLAGVLDELFTYNGPLGTMFSSEAVSLYLWAPTAQDVNVLIYSEPEGGDPLEFIELEESHGVWSTKGPVTWEGCYYVYEVSVYHPSTLQIEKCIANDPYARGLSADGRRTLIVNVDSETEKPKAWDNLVDEKPNLLSFSDISIYELHVRDFRYGEGWDFGEVAKNGRGVNASQFNLCETGIGSFNDRIRDAMLGGSPFGHPLQQGFITGLSLEPNDHDHGSKSTVDHMFAILKDHIQERVRFHNTGPSWLPGVIVMSIKDGHDGVPELSQLDPIYSYIVVNNQCVPNWYNVQQPLFEGKRSTIAPTTDNAM
ncbi:UNVERIFIED_CONTAM: Pullulanase 1, chloroplastic [Sesamum latifolium]|uniref:Pullulanase 1, chloroplastic n=1 Tax=Sesamum latifolium TaxID=2727402 RepID=A0AAW2XPM2_9LAMI